MNEAAPRRSPAEVEALVLRLAEEVSRELRQDRGGSRASLDQRQLDASLADDLGLDSLGRAELLRRLSRETGAELPDSLLVEARSLRELAAAAGGATAVAQAGAPRLERDAIAERPDSASSLLEVLDWHVRAHPDRPHLVLEKEDGAEEVMTYAALRERSLRVASGLMRDGVSPGDRVAMMLPTSMDFFESFFGILFAGAVPVPLYPPTRLAQIEEHLRRQAEILRSAGAVALVTVPEARGVAGLLRGWVPSIATIETSAALAERGVASPLPHRARSGELALLQYTSGSTGMPKGVRLTHANLLANIRGVGEAMGVVSEDVFVSWLPLYHDMGLIGGWLGSLYLSVLFVVMSPLRFLARPSRWLAAFHRHRGTLSAAPNFAYELCATRIPDDELAGLDLSCIRLLLNGAEPVSASTIRRFAARLGPRGLRPEAMAPVYGMAECAVGLCFPPHGRAPVVDRVRRDLLAREGRAEPAADGDAGGTVLESVACGRPLRGHQLRVVDAAGRDLPERREGEIEFRGPSATDGYFGNDAATRALKDGPWLRTGDRGYLAGGDLHVTGRIKDIVIRAGRNVYPQEIEEAVGAIPGIRKGCVVAFGSPDPATGTERLVVLAETRELDPSGRDALAARVKEATVAIAGEPPDEVVLAPPHGVLKTSSGKVRRAATRELWAQGKIGASGAPLPLKLARLALLTAGARLRTGARVAAALAYGGWWWTALVAVAAPTWVAIALLPRRTLCYRLFRLAGRTLVRLWGCRLEVEGLEHAPRGGAVVVPNHASYADGLVLAAAISRPFRFAVKREAESQLLAGTFARRVGAAFVDRSDASSGLGSLQEVSDAVRAGDVFVVFPEGTFYRDPGILPFKLGAFQAAVDAGVPVVPAAISGTRTLLRGGQWMPRRSPLRVTLAPPITPAGSDFAAVVALRDAARAEVLRMTGERDRGDERVVFPEPA